jgi:hypothetical protein
VTHPIDLDADADAPLADEPDSEPETWEWEDIEDFMTLGYACVDKAPTIKLRKFLRAPRFTYERRPQRSHLTDHEANSTSQASVKDSASIDSLLFGSGSFRFGKEDSHTCVIDDSVGMLANTLD